MDHWWIKNWLDDKESTLTLVMSGVALGLVLGPIFYNIFGSGMDSGIKYTFRKLADDTKLHGGAVDTLERRDNAIQRDLDRL